MSYWAMATAPFRRQYPNDSGGTTGFGFGSVAISDVNGDGKPDLVVTNACGAVGSCKTGSVGVLLGNGDGTFQKAMTYGSGGYFDTSVAVADVNGDGKPDLLVGNDCADINCVRKGALGVLIGNGDGTFQAAVIYQAKMYFGSNAAVTVGDVNGDGKQDVIVAGSSGAVVLLGNGDGTFQPAVSYGSGPAVSAAVADVNLDGKPDLLLAIYCTPTCSGGGPGAVQVLLGNGDGTFQLAVTYSSAGNDANSVVVADVDHDGRPDLLVINQCVDLVNCPNGTVSVLLGNGDGTFQTPVIYGSGGYFAQSIVVTDVNGDGRPDVLVSNFDTDSFSQFGAVSVLLNNSGASPTTTKLASSMNPAAIRQAVTYTATVAGQPGAATGTMAFQDGGSVVASVRVAGNQATYSTSYKAVGSHVLAAIYSGDVNNAASTSPTVTEYIGLFPVASRTVLITSGSPSLIGQPVTFTAKTTPGNSIYGPIPDGESVTFFDGKTTLGSVALSGGSGAFTTSSLLLKMHAIKATYAGDAIFKPSSGTVTQVVDPYPTTSSLTSSLNPSVYGQSVTWTAIVSSSGSIMPTGTVNFTWGTTIGTATLNAGGVAKLTKSNLNAGTYPLNAVYSGDANNAVSTSPVLNQVITQAFSASLTSSPNPSTQGQAVTFIATITSPTVKPMGPVTFTAGKTVLGTAQLSSGHARLTISSLPVGSTKVTATYYGDSNIAKSSASVTQTVH